MLEDSIEDRLEKGGGLLLDSEKVDAENKEGENEENKVVVLLPLHPLLAIYVCLYLVLIDLCGLCIEKIC